MLKGSEVTRYDIEYQSAPGTIDITVPKADIDLELMNLDVNDHIIKTISISEEGDNYNVQLKLQEAVEYKLLSPERGRELILELNNKDAKYREILIIVDPGHGGSDPGTISHSRYKGIGGSIGYIVETESVVDGDRFQNLYDSYGRFKQGL